jgi:hypothetical protein
MRFLSNKYSNSMTRNFCCAVVSFLCLTLMVQAEEIQTKHIFKDMGQQIQYAESNTVATTDMLTYACSNAKFWYSNEQTFGQIAIFMEKSNATVTTTVIEKLKRVNIYYYPSANYDKSHIGVSISADGSNWQPATAEYIGGMVRIDLPETGDYALKIQRASSSNFYIHTMEYTTEKCNCFRYVQP